MKLLILLNMLLAYSTNMQHTTISFREDSFYLVCRGTQQKKGFIADKFNIKDKNSTHIGLGIYENGILTVFNVSNISGEKSDLIQEKIDDFIQISDVFYWSVWECKSSKNELLKLKKNLQLYASKKITFDTDFESNNGKLYCSEFCAEILKKLNPNKFQFRLSKKPLDYLYCIALRRTVLYYYPVDFFQSNKNFKKIHEAYQ